MKRQVSRGSFAGSCKITLPPPREDSHDTRWHPRLGAGTVRVMELHPDFSVVEGEDRDEEQIERADGVVRLTYRLIEHDAEREPSEYVEVSGYVIAPVGHVQISAYCDDDEALRDGYSVIASVRPRPMSLH